MSYIEKFSKLIPDDTQMFMEEYNSFLKQVKTFDSLDEDKRFYVYGLFFQSGQPFYIGKGNGKRAYDHLVEHMKSDDSKSNSYKHEIIEAIIEEYNEFPIISIIESGLTEEESIIKEKELIDRFGRLFEDGILTNIMPGGFLSQKDAASYAGKIGGNTTRSNNLGIFSPEYDRSAQSKKNWENGLLDHIDFSAGGKVGGTITRQNNLGIYRKDLQHLRSEWARIGADALEKSGNRAGCCTKEWWQNPENKAKAIERNRSPEHRERNRKPWWANGETNIKSLECPGEGFVRGMTMRKRKSK